MSQHYLLDGYNIIKRTPNLSRGTLESQRQALINWINNSHPQGSVRNSVTIVFDGKEEFYGSFSTATIKVIFSVGQSADILIKNMVEESTSKKSWVVVSDDKDIKLYVRALGAQVLSVREFLGVSSSKKRVTGNSKGHEESKNISLTQQAKINQEMERIWFK